jgi:hypothetical protein
MKNSLHVKKSANFHVMKNSLHVKTSANKGFVNVVTVTSCHEKDTLLLGGAGARTNQPLNLNQTTKDPAQRL